MQIKYRTKISTFLANPSAVNVRRLEARSRVASFAHSAANTHGEVIEPPAQGHFGRRSAHSDHDRANPAQSGRAFRCAPGGHDEQSAASEHAFPRQWRCIWRASDQIVFNEIGRRLWGARSRTCCARCKLVQRRNEEQDNIRKRFRYR